MIIENTINSTTSTTKELIIIIFVGEHQVDGIVVKRQSTHGHVHYVVVLSTFVSTVARKENKILVSKTRKAFNGDNIHVLNSLLTNN